MSKKASRPRLANPPLLEGGNNRLLTRGEVVELVGVSTVTLWSWMRAGRFPRSRNLHGKTVWLSSEVEAFLNDLPRTKLKGDGDE
jgi:predicted DNA-binding transcriptional regulator AlpA